MRKCELCGRSTVRKKGKACMSCTRKMREEQAVIAAEEAAKRRSQPRDTQAGSIEMIAALLAAGLLVRMRAKSPRGWGVNFPETVFALWDIGQACFVRSVGPFPSLTLALETADTWNAINETSGSPRCGTTNSVLRRTLEDDYYNEYDNYSCHMCLWFDYKAPPVPKESTHDDTN